MDGHHSFSFSWDATHPNYNQPMHRHALNPLEGSSRTALAAEPNAYEVLQYRTTPQTPYGEGDGVQPNNNLKDQAGLQLDQEPDVTRPQPTVKPSRRAKYLDLDWNANRVAIKGLYIDQNKSLSETIEIMKDRHGFDASAKLYKAKFKQWNWQKNLPLETAAFMANKARTRKWQENKDTVFSFGEKLWDSDRIENTLHRAKRGRIEAPVDAPTPQGVSYKTPKMIMDSPAAEQTLDERDADTMDTSDNGFEEQHDNDMLEEESDNNIEQVALSWRGHSRTDLHAMWLRAKECRNAGQVNEAEHLLQQTFLGLSHVIGKTNEDTMKVVYTLADLYADSDRMEKAITLIEEAVQTHINTWGYENRQTQQCVLHAVEILNGWNRQGDAIGLLSLCHELLHSHASIHHTLKPENGGRANGKSGLKSITNGPGTNLARVTESILEDLSSSSVNYGLQVARAHVTAKDRAAENLLFAMIEQCHGRSDLNIQNLKAHGELLKLFEKLGVAEDQKHHFYIAFDALTEAWDAYEWEEHKIESLDFMEASLQLLANALKCGYRVETKRSFRNAADQASEVFGFDDERTVWVLITIGLVYQTHLTWDDAEEWFEEAFSAAIANEEWGPKDGIVMSLQNAMDHQHFSYLSDEGRPFKTIFGVSGIKISPGRLHLE